jgi:hypothetical protein
MRATSVPPCVGVLVGCHRTAPRSRAVSTRRGVSSSATSSPEVDALGAWITGRGGDVSKTKVGHGDRGRGLFAKRDIKSGEVVVRVPIACALSDSTRRTPPYPDAPWAVRLAHALLRERENDDHAKYANTLPTETVGFANACVATDDVVVGDLVADEHALDELGRYRLLLQSSHAAVKEKHSFQDWRWAMSLVHSRTFRVREPRAVSKDGGENNNKTTTTTRRLLVPYVDLLNHDSRADSVSCQWDVVWDDSGTGGGDFMVTACRDIKKNAEIVASYGERDDRHFFLFFGFLPKPNPHNRVTLFRGLEDAAWWYENLCGDADDTQEAWKGARHKAVQKVQEETRNTDPEVETELKNDPSQRTCVHAENEEAAALRVGVDACVDTRLLRLFELLSGDCDVAIAACRVRARVRVGLSRIPPPVCSHTAD